MGSRVAFAGLSEARARVARLAEALQRAASGEVVQAAAVKVRAYIERVARDKYGRHQAHGDALRSLVVKTSGALVTLGRNGYTRFHRWDPFRRGMPPFALKKAAQILAAELLSVLGSNDGAGRALALEVIEEQTADEAKATARKAAAKTRPRRARAAA